MKIITLIFIFLLTTPPSYAIPGEVDPNFVDSAATYAKQKARIRALRRDNLDFFGDLSQVGCNINIGNLILDDGFQDAPDEIVIIVEGDIIQANNCR